MVVPPIRVLGLVDVHWSGRSPPRWPDVSAYDVVLLGGDLTHFRGAAEARELLSPLLRQEVPCAAVAGNCDLPEVDGWLAEIGIGLDGGARSVGGLRLAGVSAGLPFGGCPFERSEEEFAEVAERALGAAAELDSDQPLVLVSHQPPYDTACDVARGRHVGSRAIRECVLEHQPDLVLCGHIHESVGQDRLGRSVIVNPGPWAVHRAAVAEVSAEGWSVELRTLTG